MFFRLRLFFILVLSGGLSGGCVPVLQNVPLPAIPHAPYQERTIRNTVSSTSRTETVKNFPAERFSFDNLDHFDNLDAAEMDFTEKETTVPFGDSVLCRNAVEAEISRTELTQPPQSPPPQPPQPQSLPLPKKTNTNINKDKKNEKTKTADKHVPDHLPDHLPNHLPENLPDKFLDFAQRETNAAVRVEIIKTLAAWNVPDLSKTLQRDLHNPYAEVRNAAMNALAESGCTEAIPQIKDQLRDSNGQNRAAAVSALVKLGSLDDVFKSANDEDQRVRAEVAKAFAERCSPQSAILAKKFLSDRYQNVQLAAVESVGCWHIEQSGPLLLDALKSNFPTVRRCAAAVLGQHGVSSSNFDPEDKPKNQAVRYEELVQIFHEKIGVAPEDGYGSKDKDNDKNKRSASVSARKETQQETQQETTPADGLQEIRRCLEDWSDSSLPKEERQLIARRLTAHGKQLMPMMDQLLEERKIPENLDKVFAEIEPAFVQIERIRSEDIVTKRSAAAELARIGTVSVPSKLAAKRIIDLTAKQTDPMVLTSLLYSLKNAAPETVCRLARPLLRSDSAEVRRLSCEMLKLFGSPEDVQPLQELLSDPSKGVVRGALQAIDALLAETNGDADSGGISSPLIFDTLKAKLLNSNDPTLQTDVAATLHRLGQSEGTDALRRLSASGDNRVRSYVAKTVSALGDSAFIPLLLRYLEDGNGTVRSDALKGLPKLTGQDIGQDGSTQEQIERWQAWAKEQR